MAILAFNSLVCCNWHFYIYTQKHTITKEQVHKNTPDIDDFLTFINAYAILLS